jgi:hypothetical protein
MITAKSDVTGNAYEELEVEQTGEDLTIAFNARYLVEILNHVDSPQTVLEFLGPLSPAAIQAARSEDSGDAALRADAAAPIGAGRLQGAQERLLRLERAAARELSQLRERSTSTPAPG